MRRTLLSSAVAVAGAAALLLSGSQSAQAAPLPVNFNWLTEFVPNIGNYQVAPPGAITVSRNADGKLPEKCTSSSHPIPVVLVHGTWENQNDNWRALSPYLKNNGYCVYTFNYGGDDNAVQGIGDLGKLIGLGSTITENGGVLDGPFDQIQGSAVQQKLATCPGLFQPAQDVCNDDPVKYTVIETNGDEIVTPYTNAFLNATTAQKNSGQVKNILIQDVCILDGSEHLSLTYDSVAAQLVLNALDPSTAKTPKCVLVLPFIGG